MTPDPAYESARVLAVRNAEDPPEPVPVTTPNLAHLEIERLRGLYADMDRRYHVG
jgi:hypothetical protein